VLCQIALQPCGVHYAELFGSGVVQTRIIREWPSADQERQQVTQPPGKRRPRARARSISSPSCRPSQARPRQASHSWVTPGPVQQGVGDTIAPRTKSFRSGRLMYARQFPANVRKLIRPLIAHDSRGGQTSAGVSRLGRAPLFLEPMTFRVCCRRSQASARRPMP